MVNVSLDDGLSGETVFDIMTDSKGYTWMATTGGISIFDGRNFMTLRILNDLGHVLQVTGLCETRSHGVYAATEGGLYQLEIGSGRFVHVLPEVKHPNTLLAVGDTVFIASEQGFLFYDGHRLNHQDVGASRKGLDNVVRHYVRDEHGTIWFLTRHNLNSYEPKTKKITTYDLTLPLGGKQILSQFDIVGNRFYIGTRNGGLYVYTLKTRECH